MTISRNQEHFIIMTVIYDELTDFVMGGGKTFRDVRELTEGVSGIPFEMNSSFVQRAITYSLQNYGNIVKQFEPLLKEWSWHRLPLLTQAILIMSYAHSKVENTDKSVIINVAVELGKKYVEPKQAKFIHGILDGVL
jgi:transcription termination factor NusB